MYNVSEEFKQAIFDGKTTRAKLVVDDIEITETNGLKNLTFEDIRYTPNLGIFGSVSSRRVIGNIYDEDNSFILEGKEFILYMGVEVDGITEYIKYGNFIVQKAPKDRVTNIIEFEALDYMVKLNEVYKTNLVFPVTIGEIFQEILDKFGLSTKTTDFKNKNHIVEANLFINNESYRDVIKAIAEIGFTWARIDEDNDLNLDFAIKENADVVFDIDKYIDVVANENQYGPINTVILRNSQIEGENVTVRDDASIIEIGAKELVIADNPFAYTQEKRIQLIEAGRSMFGLKYNAIDLQGLGTIYINCKDKLKIQTLDGEVLDSYAFNHTINYEGVALDSIKCEAMTETQTKYQNTSNVLSRVNRTEAIVDKVNQEITFVVEEIGDRSEKETSITQDLDRIENEVSAIYDTTSEVIGIKRLELEDAILGNIFKLTIKGSGKVTGGIFVNDSTILGDETILDDPRDKFTFSPTYISEYTDISELTFISNGSGTIKVIGDVNGKEIITYYDLEITEPLRANDLFYDEYILENNEAKVIRRVNPDGSSKVVEEIEDLGTLNLKLNEGNNILELLNYTAEIYCKYAIKTEFTDIYATKVEMNSTIEQTAEEINLEVNKKVDETELGTKISQNAEAVQIAWNQIGESIKFEGQGDSAKMNVYDENNNLLSSLDKTGQTYFDISGNKVGHIGLIRDYNPNTEQDEDILAFLLPVDENFHTNKRMAWGLENINGDFLPLLYLDSVSGAQSAGYSGDIALAGTLKLSNIKMDSSELNILSSEDTSIFYARKNVLEEYVSILDIFSASKSNEMIRIDMLGFIEAYDNMAESKTLNVHGVIISDKIYADNLPYFGDDVSLISGEPDNFISMVFKSGGTTLIYQNTSDKRLKDDIVDTRLNAIDKIKKIKHKQFKWKKDNKLIDCGYIAQELEELDTNFVNKAEIKDKDGNVDYNYQVNVLNLLATTTKAIQEQQVMIEELQSKIKELEAKLDG